MIIPESDAVVIITSGVRDMQSVMNLVWDKLLPALKPNQLPENAIARQKLEAKLANLLVKLPSGLPTMPLASKVSGKWFEFAKNDRGIQAISFDFSSSSPVLIVRTVGGEIRTPVGIGSWRRTPNGFANGLDTFLTVPAQPWRPVVRGQRMYIQRKAGSLRNAVYSALTFKFDGDNLCLTQA